jgi:hypothetical protein
MTVDDVSFQYVNSPVLPGAVSREQAELLHAQ